MNRILFGSEKFAVSEYTENQYTIDALVCQYVVVDEMGENAEMETSLNLNISSISDTPEEGLNHDSEKKKKIQFFCKTRERQCCPSYKARARQ